MFDLMAVTKAMADETRVRILAALEGGELCVCQLTELVSLSPSTVSKHLFLLSSARLIEGRKQGRWIYYRLAGTGAAKPVQDALKWLLENARDRPRIQEDRKRLEDILAIDTSELCGKQGKAARNRTPSSSRCSRSSS
ncbi:ArsR/SmtB family transcription factor [Desulfatirhabdium butyrativorans]|uniref:ArsR/SmtB family transcription factor n=1 Tax=Desulfatirhabdium butyrativorans TaxID=340467 RepID=UPI0003FE2F37|nr:metalloregulator ArsR/SmtB family transcription factor [Desulfatirhabdium butyrativorans]